MSRIKTLHINNFKFFRNSTPIELNGKHLLLYGENGSGKSSVYYAIYTLLEAASKSEDSVRKYFDPRNPQSLVNIFADIPQNADIPDSYIRVTDTAEKSYQLSFSELNCIHDTYLLESSRASDFLNYVSLFKFQSFRNSQVANLYGVFVDTILPSLSFPSIQYLDAEYRGASEMYAAYKKQPQKTVNAKGNEILVYKNSPEYQSYLNLENHFNDNMRNLVDFINSNVNDKIAEFDYDFKVSLEYIPASHKKYDTRVEINNFEVILHLTEYNGIEVNICHPNVFLNEARMTALAFSIRWSVLDFRLQNEVAPDAMKVLVLDDIMISLDMANRNKLIRIITHKLALQYQILFLTHDMQIFDSMKHEVMRINNIEKEEKLSETDWIIKEMYDTEIHGKHEPIIQDSGTSYTRAIKYFYGTEGHVDNIASGNAIRQAIEGAFKNLFEKANITYNSDDTPIDFSKIMIKDCLGLAKEHYARIGLTKAFVDRLDALRECLLNPASHDNPARNFYRKELKEAFDIYAILCKCDIRIPVPKNSVVSLNIEDKNNTIHEYQVVLHQDLKSYRLVENDHYAYYWDLGSFDIIIMDEPEDKRKPHRQRKITLKQLYDETYGYYIRYQLFDPDKVPPIEDGIIFNGKTLRELLVV